MPSVRLPLSRPVRVATVLLGALVASLAIRWHLLGDPVAGVDEQFYLLVGDRLWSGALPYVDIWDRKPIGLFLLYGAIRSIPGDGILAYQLAATLCLALTGALAVAIARRGAGWPASLAAGLATIGWASVMGQGLGEAPIFYDPLVMLAALAVLRVRDDANGARATWRGVGAMLACGIAITIKTVAVFEGIAFGLILLAAHRRTGDRASALMARALAYAAIGIAPSALAGAAYLAAGHGEAFWFANVTSILLRGGGTDAMSIAQLVATLLILSPLLLAAILGGGRGCTPDDRAPLIAWAVATTAGFVSIGYFQFHYAVPMIAPLAILAARGLTGLAGRIALTATLFGSGWLAAAPSPVARDRADVAALLAALPPQVTTQCLLIREGPAILYHLSHACLASRYAFPGHFSAIGEVDATGTPRGTMIAAALARRPAAIVDVATPSDSASLTAHGYVRRATRSVRLYGATRVDLSIWWRRDLVSQMSTLGPYAGGSMRDLKA